MIRLFLCTFSKVWSIVGFCSFSFSFPLKNLLSRLLPGNHSSRLLPPVSHLAKSCQSFGVSRNAEKAPTRSQHLCAFTSLDGKFPSAQCGSLVCSPCVSFRVSPPPPVLLMHLKRTATPLPPAPTGRPPLLFSDTTIVGSGTPTSSVLCISPLLTASLSSLVPPSPSSSYLTHSHAAQWSFHERSLFDADMYV